MYKKAKEPYMTHKETVNDNHKSMSSQQGKGVIKNSPSVISQQRYKHQTR